MVFVCQYSAKLEVDVAKYSLEILSPVHIGNGNKLNQASFLMERDIVYVVNPDTFVAFLPQNLKIQLLEIAEKGERLSLHKFLPKEIKNKIKTRCFYKIPLAATPLHSGKYRLFEIDEFIKESNNSYIPGSELKGALRTAIIFQLIQDNFDSVVSHIQNLKGIPVKQMIRQGKGLLKNEKKVASEQIKRIEGEIQNCLMRGKEKDAKYDILKLLQISDSKSTPAENSLVVGKTIVLDCEKGPLGFAIYQEFLKPGCKFEIPTISIPETAKKEEITNCLGFSENQKDVIRRIENLFQTAYEFTKELIEAEGDYFKNISLLDHNKKARILKQLEMIASKNTPRTPIMRIGMGEGVLSHTIWLAIKKKDKNLYQQILNLQPTETFPKSRKLYEDRDGNYYTMGWVQLKKE